jgi:NAD(P)-dependent dehydrogenase (short-subunit alcohol dehydrogenase family)
MKGKRALVTGGTRGVGRAIARELARRGCGVAALYLRNRTAAAETEEELRALGAEALVVRADVRSTDRLDGAFDAVRERWGGLDYLVSNAVLGVLRPVEELGERGWELCMDANARALLRCAERALPLFPEGGGSVVALSSIGARRCLPGYAGIGAAKGAIETLVRYMAREWGARGVRVNAVSGGPVDTDALRTFPEWQEMVRETTASTPLGRFGTPEDLARVAVWLLSEDAGWVTGQTVVADGGLTLA